MSLTWLACTACQYHDRVLQLPTQSLSQTLGTSLQALCADPYSPSTESPEACKGLRMFWVGSDGETKRSLGGAF